MNILCTDPSLVEVLTKANPSYVVTLVQIEANQNDYNSIDYMIELASLFNDIDHTDLVLAFSTYYDYENKCEIHIEDFDSTAIVEYSQKVYFMIINNNNKTLDVVIEVLRLISNKGLITYEYYDDGMQLTSDINLVLRSFYYNLYSMMEPSYSIPLQLIPTLA